MSYDLLNLQWYLNGPFEGEMLEVKVVVSWLEEGVSRE